MALITCPACGKQISDRAVSCPHCGEPIQGQEPMMEYQQQEPVQQYDESGDNNNRKYIAPLAIFAGVLLAVLVGVIAYNKGAKNVDETATEPASESYTAVDTSSTISPSAPFNTSMQPQTESKSEDDAVKSAEETSEDLPSIPRHSSHHHRSSRPHNPSIDEMINNAPPAAWR